MNILLWHVHGSWTTAFVQGPHTYLVPVTPDRGPDGLGRARTFAWPASVREVTPRELRDDAGRRGRPAAPARTRARRALARRPPPRPGLPAVYLEHNAPRRRRPAHPAPAGRPRRPDAGARHPLQPADVGLRRHPHRGRRARHRRPGPPLDRRAGQRAAVVVNEPVRRGRSPVRTCCPRFAGAAPLDVFGMRTDGWPGTWACRRNGAAARNCRSATCTRRWPGGGCTCTRCAGPLSGCPCWRRCTWGCRSWRWPPPRRSRRCREGAGACPTGPTSSPGAARRYLADPGAAAEDGARARQAALDRYGLKRFLDDWERLITEVCS